MKKMYILQFKIFRTKLKDLHTCLVENSSFHHFPDDCGEPFYYCQIYSGNFYFIHKFSSFFMSTVSQKLDFILKINTSFLKSPSLFFFMWL